MRFLPRCGANERYSHKTLRFVYGESSCKANCLSMMQQSKKEMATWKHHQCFGDLTVPTLPFFLLLNLRLLTSSRCFSQDGHLQSVAEREDTNITFVFEKETQKVRMYFL